VDKEYEHWSGKPITPGAHADVCLTPQSVADGWSAHCSCGEWMTFVYSQDFPIRELAIQELKQRHANHTQTEDRRG